ncbi:MAG: ribonucleoside triphosphate reductase [Candidatus Diapherotrites archaeon]|nr:ribonucleoside triphosphate reductase [Candidatus Diapherotrites archaeon]
MPKFVIKRDGSKALFDPLKIESAIWKAVSAVGGTDRERSNEIAKKVVEKISILYSEEKIPGVEEIQDLVETTLIKGGHDKTAKAYILYRHQRELLRRTEDMVNNFEIISQYITQEDWRVRENANMAYSLQGLNFNISGRVVSNYWLGRIYPKEVAEAHKNADFHIHDLDVLGAYCVGWDLKQLLLEGFTGVRGKVASKPAKHFRVALGQIVNFFYTLQGESAGAQAFSSFDTYLAPFIRYDGLDRTQVKQAMQEFVFNCAVPTRVGFQNPFTNLTMDLSPPAHIANDPVVIGGKLMETTYSDFQEEMDLLNEIFCEVMTEGDATGRPFSFPIPTYNITKDFDWGSKKYDGIWDMTAKYGIPYFANFINSDMKPEDTRSMCCRLRISNKELNKRGGGLFGANPLTGSLGVVTINLARIGFLSKSEDDFFNRLGYLMDLAKESLVIKRKTIERLTDQGLYPYSRFYLRSIKEQTGGYWTNHFSTIGLLGMNEALINFMKKNLLQKEGQAFAIKVLNFMRDRLQGYQNETGDIFNLEATPGEGTTRRFAWADKKKFPAIIVANEVNFKEHGAPPYYTNSSQLPVSSSLDLFEALDFQDPLQTLYTGGTVFHVFLGEKLPSKEATKNLVRKISSNYRMPYFSLTPSFSICPIHGYLSGEHEYCPVCERE